MVNLRETKLKGDNAFRENDYTLASFYYSTALGYDPLNATLLSNRSLCLLRMKMEIGAFNDAMACIRLKPDWPKAYYRVGAALSANGICSFSTVYYLFNVFYIDTLIGSII
ncbi:hypothetical protein ACHQM5_010529 [Ranunculus cassubicifolius]